MHRRTVAMAAAVSGLLLSACGGAEPNKADQPPAVVDAPSSNPSPDAGASSAPIGGPVDAASINANELGQVPVMMYHQIKEDAKGEYDQTPAEFKAELERMHRMGFVPITTAALVAGKVDIPAGKHPVVLTFDDSTISQIQIGTDGKPTPDSAVGILEEFETANPDFTATGSFYVNGSPFQDPKAVPWLVDNGYEVGVHTLNHINLKQSSDSKIQQELAGNSEDIKASAPSAVVSTLALPFGISPVNKQLVRGGTYEGKSYSLVGVLLVGSNPAPSPFAAKFEPYAIPRIRSGPATVPTDSEYWLNQFEKNPKSIYTSDGDPNKVSFPRADQAKLDSEFAGKANAYDEGSSPNAGPSSPPTAGTAAATAVPSSTPSATTTP
ncbi:MAG: polysaccharide deacetylase family protein [Sporichthyaceae bacterium]